MVPLAKKRRVSKSDADKNEENHSEDESPQPRVAESRDSSTLDEEGSTAAENEASDAPRKTFKELVRLCPIPNLRAILDLTGGVLQ
jgi:hypothetical protein